MPSEGRQGYRTVACASAILLNADRAILFQQRDDTPTIAFPSFWALPGGHLEPGETPDAAIRRELFEEIEYQGALSFWTSYTFWRTADVLVQQSLYVGVLVLSVAQIPLHEGQALRFLSAADLDHFPIAFGFDTWCRRYLADHPASPRAD